MRMCGSRKPCQSAGYATKHAALSLLLGPSSDAMRGWASPTSFFTSFLPFASGPCRFLPPPVRMQMRCVLRCRCARLLVRQTWLCSSNRWPSLKTPANKSSKTTSKEARQPFHFFPSALFAAQRNVSFPRHFHLKSSRPPVAFDGGIAQHSSAEYQPFFFFFYSSSTLSHSLTIDCVEQSKNGQRVATSSKNPPISNLLD